MDNMNSRFLSAFSYFWNNWNGKKVLLKLFVCGSATTWMIDKLIGDKGGLYGRVSRQIYLAPFTLCDTEQFLNDVKVFDSNTSIRRIEGEKNDSGYCTSSNEYQLQIRRTI